MSDTNKIVAENQLPGDPNWNITAQDSTIEGFSADISTNVGGTVSFKINTDSSDYRVEIYRLGYYGGDGARLVTTIEHQGATPVIQPTPITDASTGLIDAGNWSVTDMWNVPSDAVSGVYVAKLVRQDGKSAGSGENLIPFVVRDDGSSSDIVLQTSDATWEAYNKWGGHDLYDGSTVAVSYNRPFVTDSTWLTPFNYLFGGELPAIRWLEENGYDVSYIAEVDTARSGQLLLNHNVFVSAGHDEYWSAEQVNNVLAARDAGVNLAFWSGNEVYWKTRWSSGVGGTDFRTLTSYKTTQSFVADPSGIWTGTWADPAGTDWPQNQLTGQLYKVNVPGGGPDQSIDVTYDQSQFRLWADTPIALLQPGEVGEIGAGYLGYELDEAAYNGVQPAGLVQLSSTTMEVSGYLYDAGLTYGPGTATHSVTLYRAPSGALVFGAGTIFWSWGLDANHAPGPNGELPPADPSVQQAMVNLFADMGVQPGSLQPGLVLAAQSSDFSAPVATVGNVAGITPETSGNIVTVTGTASDTGGGVVAALEVSVDDGATWRLASGGSAWSYTWDMTDPGWHTILARATDDSINLGNTAAKKIEIFGFDQTGYLAANPDVATSGVDPLTEYKTSGWQEGRDPYFDFDSQLYMIYNPDVAATGLDPLTHYLTIGMNEGRRTAPAIGRDIQADDFDAEYYYLANPDVAASGMDAYQHWIDFGWKEGRNPNAYFDTKYYLSQNPDVAAAGVDPLEHYHTIGWQEGRNPSALFDGNSYSAEYSDIATANMDPLQHYLKAGAFEQRHSQDPDFDANYYLQENPDVAAAGVDPYQHFSTIGWKEGRNPDAYFDTKYYLTQNPDVAAAGVNPLDHYHIIGWEEGRNPSAAFDTNAYLGAYQDVASAGIDPLQHYLLSGISEGRLVTPVPIV